MRHNFTVLTTAAVLNQRRLLKKLQHKKKESTGVEAKERMHSLSSTPWMGLVGVLGSFFLPTLQNVNCSIRSSFLSPCFVLLIEEA